MTQKLSVAWRQMWSPPHGFTPQDAEQAFMADYCGRFAAHRRVAVLLGLLIGTLYLGFDLLYSAGDPGFAPVLHQVLLNRVATSLLLVLCLLLFRSPRFERDESFATAGLVLGAWAQFLMYCRGFLLVPYPYDYMYFFMGMFICMIFAFSMLRLRARPLIVLLGLCVGSAACTFYASHGLDTASTQGPAARIYLGLSLSFLVSVATMGAVVGILLERSERASFVRASELATSNLALRRHAQEVERLHEALQQSSHEAQERAQALIELKERMRAEAERRNREKSQFLAAAVHDLKQPIQAIGNALEPGQMALAQQDLSQARDMLDLAASATQLMREQIAAILEISRLESGFIQPEPVSFDLDELVRHVRAQVADLALREGVVLEWQAAGSPPPIVCSDWHFCSRILLNLVSNGIKYQDHSKPERWIRLRTLALPQGLALEVADNGIGIEANLLESGAIFKPFFQANNRRREREKGVGLGLSIVHAMLAVMPQHSLQVSSAPGEGSCFTLRLPWGSAPNRFDHGDAQPLLAQEQALGSQLEGMYVLYVEDDAHVNAATQALFTAYGLRFEAAESLAGAEALIQEMERTPDALVTDYRLPEGYTARHVINSTFAAFGMLPTIVVTGEAQHALDLPQACVLLHKPVSSTQLLRALSEIRAAAAKIDLRTVE